MTSKKIIIVGYGYLGSRICGIISGSRKIQKSWKQSDISNLEIAAVVEPDEEKSAAAAKLMPEIPVVPNITELDDRVLQVEGTFIRDFAPMSERLTLLKFANQKTIPILLEKPLSQACFDLSRDDSNIVGVGLSEVRNPVVAKIRQHIRDKFSRIRSIRVARINSVYSMRLHSDSCYRNGIEGGSFLDKMIHDLHLLEQGYYLGSKCVLHSIDKVNEVRLDSVSKQDVFSDITLNMKTNRDDLQVRLVSSWQGVPPDLADRLEIDPELIKQSCCRYSLERSSVQAENLKLVAVSGVDNSGGHLTLIGNLQSRRDVAAGIWLKGENFKTYEKIRFNVPIVAATSAFARGQRVSLQEAAASHDIAFECSQRLNSEFALV